ncbi:16S rRNA (adenine(1518)-N(6)/adenine(1519)-N(6))-dimethyltransferase RsmA [Rubrobacter aplysinae]|uniref:16S rRNA (adenine(1518)-N(6)/adenine(1519)-N(6))- dimethyltransferase RsmA n=1 Tax=Rubrobacter aplysinae TaxID=909625 RepID=UPI001364D6FB|nr:16S rRNA (adenine(1518)-N(6)/adenine(1519)-N(6))-dimethyltransferase RsmA [Rubrobacter aplysinae]
MSQPRPGRREAPKKRFGQHFLTDPNTARIVAAGVGAGDVVVEIGAGRGALTTVLADRARLVHALEVDEGVMPELRAALAGRDNVRVHAADALVFDYAVLDPPPSAMVANLPYNVASPLVLGLLERVPGVRRLRFMVQLEVARRMAAAPRTKDYGSYAVLLQLLGEVSVEHRVSRRVFDPPPRVDSAVVEVRRRVEPLFGEAEYAGLKELVLAAFGNRRKRLANNLAAGDRARAPEALASVGHGPDARAEELSPAEFVGLYRWLEEGAGGSPG